MKNLYCGNNLYFCARNNSKGMKEKLKGHSAMFTANFLWGIMSPISKAIFLTGTISAFSLTNMRMAGAAILFWIASLFMPILKEHGIEAPMGTVVTVVGLMKGRVSFIKELWDTCKFFFVAPTEYDEKTVKKRWKEDSAVRMTELADLLESLDDFSLAHQEEVVMKWIEDHGYHMGNIMNAFRLTLVGEGKGPHMFDISAVLGKEETVRRMRRAVEVLK